MKKILVYGSLRNGMYNNSRIFGSNREPIETIVMEGYDLYSLGSYPAIKKGDNKVVMELLEVSEEEYERIERMELGAGYITEYSEEYKAYFWVYKDAYDFLKTKKPIESGDWVQYLTDKGD